MTEPLIAIEGNLRLPPLRALANPSLTFGREWSPARTRPVRSHSEVPITAARFETAYVEPLSVRDGESPYRAANIWGMFSEGRSHRKPIQPTQTEAVSAKPAAHDDERKEPRLGPVPIQLGVKAPAAASAATAAAQGRYGFLHKPVKGAIALACAALIAWLLFSHEQHPANEEPATVVAATNANANADAKPVAASQVEAGGAMNTGQARSTANVATAQPAAVVARNTEPQASASSVTIHRATLTKPTPITVHASAKPRELRTRGASIERQAQAASPAVHAPARSQTRIAASKLPEKRGSHAIAARGAHRSTVEKDYIVADTPAWTAEPARRSHHAAYRGYRGYREQVAQERALPRRQPSGSMNVEALYAILQHNPALDNNSRRHADDATVN
ncbi:hypothetical protein [Caballeronia concitans]|uniref:Uncharacterized protein n=1 Tax=Caballeronia concitans TaxID=1777133 RepID=A0A658QZH4_9BURK|nr:hypothetical protein [Caballeronia concitans]SAL34441.1 hypothetical protein AWB72_03277 [Caballeronia concitans]